MKSPPSPSLAVLAGNLEKLRAAHPLLKSQAAIGKKAGIDQRTVGRVLNQEHEPTLAQLTKLAKAFNVEPWQMLAPNLGADLYLIDKERRVVPVSTPSSWGDMDGSPGPRSDAPGKRESSK